MHFVLQKTRIKRTPMRTPKYGIVGQTTKHLTAMKHTQKSPENGKLPPLVPLASW